MNTLSSFLTLREYFGIGPRWLGLRFTIDLDMIAPGHLGPTRKAGLNIVPDSRNFQQQRRNDKYHGTPGV
jgi:hypothetical protein